MSGDPSVSIIIPVYNGANYLGPAIESALAQTYASFEVLVINDGSTDGGATRAVAEGFGNRIRYIEKPNGGVATALNAGITAMHGTLFSWLSHDDLYQPWKLETQVKTWQRFGPRCVVIGDFETMDAHGTTQDLVPVGNYNLVARPLDAVFDGLINGCALLVPRVLFDEAGLFEPGLPTTQDYHLWYRIARLVPFVHCPGAGVRQRIHPLQGSRQLSHLDEASRMFAHLIEATPVSLMQAYDGSELCFLLRVRRRLGAVYPGLRAYLDGRIETAFQTVRYGVVWTAAPPDPDAAARSLAALNPPPAVMTPDTPTDPAEAAPALDADIVAFLPPERLPSRAQWRTALEALLLTGADAARSKTGAAPADGTFIWRDALPAFANEPEGLLWTEYDAVPGETELAGAFAGTATLDYHAYLCLPELIRRLTGQLRPGYPAILLVAHADGGTWTHVRHLAAVTRQADCILGLGGPGGTLRLRKAESRIDAGGGIVFRLPEHAPDLVRILQMIGVRRVDVHSVYGFEPEAEALLQHLALPMDLTLLDYNLVARDPHLRNQDGDFVDQPGQLANLLHPAASPLFGRAERVFALSRDMIWRLGALCPDLEPVYAPPGSRTRIQHVFPPVLRAGEPLRILLVGTLVAHKGSRVVIEAARQASARNLPLTFHHLGASGIAPDEHAALPASLILHGPFDGNSYSERLGAIAPHLGWLPAQVPETWSYVLSEFMDACLPVAASALGALVERCHGRPATWLLAWNAPARDWVKLFLTLHATGLSHPPQWAPIDHLPDPTPVGPEEYLRPLLASQTSHQAA